MSTVFLRPDRYASTYWFGKMNATETYIIILILICLTNGAPKRVTTKLFNSTQRYTKVFLVQLLHDDRLHAVFWTQSFPVFFLQKVNILNRRTISIEPGAKHGLEIVAGFRETSIPWPFDSSLNAKHQDIKLWGVKSSSKNAHRLKIKTLLIQNSQESQHRKHSGNLGQSHTHIWRRVVTSQNIVQWLEVGPWLDRSLWSIFQLTCLPFRHLWAQTHIYSKTRWFIQHTWYLKIFCHTYFESIHINGWTWLNHYTNKNCRKAHQKKNPNKNSFHQRPKPLRGKVLGSKRISKTNAMENTVNLSMSR